MYDWDRDKARRNFEKHGVSFFEAAGAFEDPLGLDAADEGHSWRGTVVRIISARLASRKERARYAEA